MNKTEYGPFSSCLHDCDNLIGDSFCRCFAHVINIGAKTGLAQLTKLPKARNNEEDEDSSGPTVPVFYDDRFDDDDTGDYGTSPESNSALVADPAYRDALANDPVSRARALARACRASGERREEFRRVIKAGNVAESFRDAKRLREVELLLDVVTRWSATFLMTDRFLELYEVCCIAVFRITIMLTCTPGNRRSTREVQISLVTRPSAVANRTPSVG